MPPHALIAGPESDVNARVVDELTSAYAERVAQLLGGPNLVGRSVEIAVWAVLIVTGRELLAAALTLACRRVMLAATGGRPVQLRFDADYSLSQNTTLGTVKVPLFAFREDGRTRCPAREQVFPLHPKCCSSELLVEWEARVGCQLPFRQAEEALTFFSHDAVHTEDTTISRHIGVVGAMLERNWTCRAPEDVATILVTRATRDKKSGQPLLYVSTDAHALRRYVDDTWKAEYKMINGIRLWCIDRRTGQTVHLGGEYTWGDCRDVAVRVRSLLDLLVPTGDAAPQLVLVTDGMPWIRDHVYNIMPEGTRMILDFYHLAERLAKYAAARFGKDTKEGKAWVRKMVARLTGKRPYKKRVLAKRRGHKKNRRSKRDPFRTVHPCEHPHGAGDDLILTLIEDEPASDALDSLMGYVAANLDRIDYSTYRAHGMQIGSGAMESLHRVASQMRLKLAGARWTAERALAVLNTRLMLLADRWSAFWARPDLSAALAMAFGSRTAGEAV